MHRQTDKVEATVAMVGAIEATEVMNIDKVVNVVPIITCGTLAEDEELAGLVSGNGLRRHREKELGIVYNGPWVGSMKTADGIVKAELHTVTSKGFQIESVSTRERIARGKERTAVVVSEMSEMRSTGTKEEGIGSRDGVVRINIVVVSTEAGIHRGKVDRHHALVGAIEDADAEALGLGDKIFGSGGTTNHSVDRSV